jgi:hypothetical protein
VEEMVESNRIRLFNRQNFGIDVEYNKEVIVIHLPWITKFSVSTFKEMKQDLKEFSHFFNTVGYSKLYAAVDTNDIKIKTLLKKLGFTRTAISGDVDVYEKET